MCYSHSLPYKAASLGSQTALARLQILLELRQALSGMCLGQKEASRGIVKPASFKTQEYRSVVLENGIEFVLVSDGELDKAGASIDVSHLLPLPHEILSSGSLLSCFFDNTYEVFRLPQVRVGSLSDPEDTPGLAHFCEHMLFYASAKYPEEDAYSKFVVGYAPSCP